MRACERDHGLEKVGLGKEVIKVRCDQHGQCYVRLLDDVSKAMCRYMDRSGRECVCVRVREITVWEIVGLGKEVIKVRCRQHGQCYVRLLDGI